MYICPMCQKEYSQESAMVKHLSICWKERNPNHVSKPAPRSEDIEVINANDDVLNFFNNLKEQK